MTIPSISILRFWAATFAFAGTGLTSVAGEWREIGAEPAGWVGAIDAADFSEGTIAWRSDGRGTLYWAEELGDFEVELEFRLPRNGNNGLAIRYPGTGDPAYAGLCEIQLLDDDGPRHVGLDPRQYTGSAYGLVAATRGHLRAVGEWNAIRVSVRGFRVRVTLNGTVTLDTDLAQVDPSTSLGGKAHPGLRRTRGHFGFAGHRSEVAFRNIRLRSL